ncbi:RING zinc finger protein [Plasmodium gonderi]|uniref:RING zinc finger protein n=1 Tax=Plasmodium gonderi TaxID=77519 RepID=A0A1Y1JHD9_PLAGO|nr:RING zinc finger protein [Plasmodium gonderi]GAW81949.1 RING zinc finger protein [Plasmodium gonderi]
MNVHLDDSSSNGNYIELNDTEEVLYRYLTITLYLCWMLCILTLVIISIHFIETPCEACDYYNRVVVIIILIKSIFHISLTIMRIKKRDEIENDERLKNLTIYFIKLFNSLTFFLALVSLYLLHFYNNKCSFNTVALKFIKLYYYFTITLYFLPLLFYISLGLFLSLIICIIINFSVDENDRIPTPENVIKKLAVLKYRDLDFVHNRENKNNIKKKKKKFKKPSFEIIFDKVKRAMRRKDKKDKKKINTHSTSKNENHADENLKEMLKPLNPNDPNEQSNHANEVSPICFSSSGFKGISKEQHKERDKDRENGEDIDRASDGAIDQGIEREDEDICSICMMSYNPNDEVMIMPCDKRHFFHVACLTKWLYKSQVCPICRTNIVTSLNAKNEIV